MKASPETAAGIFVAVIGGALFLSLDGCSESTHRECHYECDPTTQERVFLTCLEKLPHGPERLAASGNDWDEVVGECKSSAAAIACKYNCVTVRGWGIDQ